jgi:hypothetical protein
MKYKLDLTEKNLTLHRRQSLDTQALCEELRGGDFLAGAGRQFEAE